MDIGRFTGQIQQGMTVRSADGDKLGKVIAIGASEFHIEKGLFFPKDYVASLEDVQDVRGDEIILRSGSETLRRADEEPTQRAAEPIRTTPQPGAMPARASTMSADDRLDRTDEGREMRMPLAEERLDVTTREQNAGAVRLKKEVVEEVETVNVPVRKERVRVDRISRPEGEMQAAGPNAFQEDEIVVPLVEEEVVVEKRAVVTGEVRISKESYEEDRRVAESVRHEEARVESEGDVRHAGHYTDDDLDPNKRR